MAYNERLAERVRKGLPRRLRVEEKRMMGGLTFMVNGKMSLGIVKDDLMVRLDPAVYEAALKRTGCRVMDFTGKPMKGFVFVNPKGTGRKEQLQFWIALALAFNKRAKASTARKAQQSPGLGRSKRPQTGHS